MKLTKTINTVLFIIAFLILPVLAFAQDPQSQPSIAEDIIVKLQVPLPFVPDNPNLSQYLQGVYRLLIGAGALFAVIMIIIAGYQWMFSGGSSDKTGAAKKRILGAVVGLMLALLSYIILNAITPNLVSLDQPFVPPVPWLEFNAGETCKDSARLKQYEDQGLLLQVKQKVEPSAPIPPQFMDRGLASCGYKYDVYSMNRAPLQQGGKVIDECMGGNCGDRQSCVNNQCISALMYGTISWSPDNGYVDYLEIYSVCDDLLRAYPVGTKDVTEKAIVYIIPSNFEGEARLDYKEQEKICKAMGKNFKGFVLKAEVNNDCYSWSPTSDKDYAIGRSCNKPLTSLTSSGEKKYAFGSIDWNQIKKDDLFQLSDFDGKAFECNLVINRSDFPVRKKSFSDPPAKCPWYEYRE